LPLDKRTLATMTDAQLTEQQEIDRQELALRRRQRRLAKLPVLQDRRESLRTLIAAGIVTRQGKLAASYR
jgi:hypothetical protein